jgi:hypothetical protein
VTRCPPRDLGIVEVQIFSSIKTNTNFETQEALGHATQDFSDIDLQITDGFDLVGVFR